MYDKYISVDEFARIHAMHPDAVRFILVKDSKLPETQRRIKGAYKTKEGNRGDWCIPLESAKAFQFLAKGRPKAKEQI